MGDFTKFAEELDPVTSLLDAFAAEPPCDHLHIIMKVSDTGQWEVFSVAEHYWSDFTHFISSASLLKKLGILVIHIFLVFCLVHFNSLVLFHSLFTLIILTNWILSTCFCCHIFYTSPSVLLLQLDKSMVLGISLLMKDNAQSWPFCTSDVKWNINLRKKITEHPQHGAPQLASQGLIKETQHR
jgi:hypothetical protein